MKRVLIVISIIVAVLAILFLFLISRPGQKGLNKLAQPALERNQQNMSRKVDASKLAAALAEYISTHQNTLPQKTATESTTMLALCGADCTEANKKTVSLGYYANSPSAVAFHEYSADLKVPDLQTMYIAPNANCKGDASGVGTSTIGQKHLSIVVLFALDEHNQKQQCISPY